MIYLATALKKNLVCVGIRKFMSHPLGRLLESAPGAVQMHCGGIEIVSMNISLYHVEKWQLLSVGAQVVMTS